MDKNGVNDLRRITQEMIVPGVVHQRHIQPNALLIFTGLAADRPDGTTEVQAYFATNTNVLSIWNGTSWKSTTLS